MLTDAPIPHWLWRLALGVLALSVVGVSALALALANGWADPPRAGPLRWMDDFKRGLDRWEARAPEGVTAEASGGALAFTFTAPDQWAYALTDSPGPAFTLEIAGAQRAGDVGAAYGLVFGWEDETRFNWVVMNGNGYVEVVGPAATWFAWQQWPHLLYGYEANRVRVDVVNHAVTARINDELLVAFDTPTTGKIGVAARSSAPGQVVVFGWAMVWSR
jgi:hypothetical protein